MADLGTSDLGAEVTARRSFGRGCGGGGICVKRVGAALTFEELIFAAATIGCAAFAVVVFVVIFIVVIRGCESVVIFILVVVIAAFLAAESTAPFAAMGNSSTSGVSS